MPSRSDGETDKGDIFSLLSAHRRRYTIHFCKREEGPVELSDLAEQVAAWEQEKDIEELEWDERKKVYTSLQQTHLPTLADAGMITFENGTIELTDRAKELDVYLDIVSGESIPWGSYYLGLSAVGFAVLGGVWLDILPTDLLPVEGWAALVVATFAISAAIHVSQSRRFRLGKMEEPP